MASVTIRVDDQTKKEAARIVEDFGFDLSSVTRAFYRQIVREHRIPFKALPIQSQTKKACKVFRETDEIIASGGTGRSFASGRELLDAAIKG